MEVTADIQNKGEAEGQVRLSYNLVIGQHDTWNMNWKLHQHVGLHVSWHASTAIYTQVRKWEVSKSLASFCQTQ